ncbi:MAG: hypothetical protein GXC72_13485 [Chitinophagaceae bacterium]|jgi:hypothetical protein|nr:hypothetical protein [Chitinophagaceae bacterium]
MNLIRQQALQHLTGASSLRAIPASALEDLASRYPYFAPAQLLLAAHRAQDSDDPRHWGKAALLVPNTRWLNGLLEKEAQEVADIDTPATAHQPVTATALEIPTMERVREMIRSINPTELADNDPEVDDTGDETAIDTASEGDAKIAAILSDQLASFKEPVAETDQLEIIPEKRLHTIDYFASQGIKIDLNQVSQDKLTNQLRKFTDWLKQMKHPNPADLGTDTDLEKAVVLIAENSNESREVVTETMAEVLEKQGQTEKAIQLYIKLSFINPEKSAYFAGKIEQLKGI